MECLHCGLYCHSIERNIRHVNRVPKCKEFYLASVPPSVFEISRKRKANKQSDKMLKLPAIRIDGSIARRDPVP